MTPDPPAKVDDAAGILGRRNAVAKLVAAAVVSFALLVTLDPLPPAVALAVELGTVPLFGIGLRTLARRGWPLLLSAAGVGLAQTLLGTGGWLVSLGLALRVPAVALPGVIVFATTDPTDLADALIQQARAPARFAIGALAAFRLMPLLGDEWRLLRLARRARGLDAGGNPLAQVRQFGALTFAILVGAIRRGTRLATAMDARGFDSGRPRTIARPQRFTAADAALIAGACV
ncbi:MAG TPA: energy-coupling factor transporter transmembrane component T, partial [Rugosimonospora sp.]|nr:energy-coupling factor transporter transmembrane component T [Rugosimonospora sp.]